MDDCKHEKMDKLTVEACFFCHRTDVELDLRQQLAAANSTKEKEKYFYMDRVEELKETCLTHAQIAFAQQQQIAKLQKVADAARTLLPHLSFCNRSTCCEYCRQAARVQKALAELDAP